jgi:ribosomal protein L29
MAKKTILTEKSPEELAKLLKEHRESLRTLRFSAAGSRPKDSHAPLKTRREIARVLTEMGNRAKKA